MFVEHIEDGSGYSRLDSPLFVWKIFELWNSLSFQNDIPRRCFMKKKDFC